MVGEKYVYYLGFKGGMMGQAIILVSFYLLLLKAGNLIYLYTAYVGVGI